MNGERGAITKWFKVSELSSGFAKSQPRTQVVLGHGHVDRLFALKPQKSGASCLLLLEMVISLGVDGKENRDERGRRRCPRQECWSRERGQRRGWLCRCAPGLSQPSAQSWTPARSEPTPVQLLGVEPFPLRFNPFRSSFIEGFSWNEPGPKIYLWRREMKFW